MFSKQQPHPPRLVSPLSQHNLNVLGIVEGRVKESGTRIPAEPVRDAHNFFKVPYEISGKKFVKSLAPDTAELRQRIFPQAFVDKLDSLLAESLTRLRRVHGNEGLTHACALVTNEGRVAIGLPLFHGNPPQQSGPEWIASSTLVSRGLFGRIVGLFVRTENPQSSQCISSDALDIFRHQIHPALEEIPVVVRYTVDELTHTHESFLPRKMQHLELPLVNERGIRPRAAKFFETVQKLPRPFSVLLQEGVQKHQIYDGILENLRDLFSNTTTDNRHRPARKGHATAVIVGDRVIFAVNPKHSHFPSGANCAERFSLGNMETYFITADCHAGNVRPLLTLPHVEALLLFSADYHTADGHAKAPHVCSLCVDLMSSRLNPNTGSMDVVNGCDQDGKIIYSINTLKEQDYAASERENVRRRE